MRRIRRYTRREPSRAHTSRPVFWTMRCSCGSMRHMAPPMAAGERWATPAATYLALLLQCVQASFLSLETVTSRNIRTEMSTSTTPRAAPCMSGETSSKGRAKTYISGKPMTLNIRSEKNVTLLSAKLLMPTMYKATLTTSNSKCLQANHVSKPCITGKRITASNVPQTFKPTKIGSIHSWKMFRRQQPASITAAITTTTYITIRVFQTTGDISK
mmetsp:Transcript_153444/g.491833  ORF Transcript_153444/g.491833 Transcript_153444/m.491833 type:complete len:215 (+) Transcript_153444:58-702(+)